MEKNYEVLKHYLQSEKQAGNMKKRHRVPQMHRDEDQIVISYPVSYTHLDVYKRQEQEPPQRLYFRRQKTS